MYVRDLLLIKIDEFGLMQWSQIYGGSDNDYGYSVIQTLDGGYIVTGNTVSYAVGGNDLWLIKTDDEGNVE